MRFRRPPAGWLPDGAFFAGFLAYAIIGLDTRLVFHWQSPVFYLTSEFFLPFLKYAGGVADWLYALAAQAFPSQVGGAMVLTAMAAASTALAGRCCRAVPVLRFIPSILLVYSLNVYSDRTPIAIALLLGLGAAVVFFSRQAQPLWLALLLLAAAYYTGGMAAAMFAAATGGLLVARREYWKAAAVAGAALIPVFGVETARHWVDAVVPSLLCLFCALAGFLRGRPPAPQRRWWAGVALAGLAAVAVLAYRTNDRDRRLATLDYHTAHENWSQVLAAAEKLRTPDFNSLTRYEINLALHETHRLGDDMFRFPQSESTIPRLRTNTFLPYMLRVTDLLLRLGRANDAEHFGNEAMILGDGDSRVLRLLADVEIAKEQPEAARKYLTILSGEAASARWASARLDLIDNPVRLAADERFQALRRRNVRADDFIAVWQNPEKPDADVNRLLLDQLDADPSNRMAFEFLMGNYLLARDLAGARALMPRLPQTGTGRTPRHYQEAMAMYADAAGQPVAVDGFAIEPETLNRMAVFKRLMSQSAGRDAAMRAAWDRFRDSYFFYFVFGPGDYR
jgi:hypothetical protein